MLLRQLLLVLTALLSGCRQTLAQCPPPGFDAVSAFDVERYVDDRWFSVEQLPVFFQPESQFYCVFADYTIKSCLFSFLPNFCERRPTEILVYNSARKGSTTGRIASINFKATIPNEVDDPAKANIGSRFRPSILRKGTNYWVVAVGNFNDLEGFSSLPEPEFYYEWAIITAGHPDKEHTDGKCYSETGMWIFSRFLVPPNGTVAAIEAIASGLGLAVDVLKPVEQEGCTVDEGKGGIRGFLASIATVLGTFLFNK
jgi:lipocalin